jgi:hypothetical protein
MKALTARWQRSPGLPIFLLTLAVYVALVPWMARAWARGGDEPHYLLAAHSLAIDGDLDLANNYAQQDYHAFYGEYYLNPHVLWRPDGQQVLTHNLGLSLVRLSGLSRNHRRAGRDPGRASSVGQALRASA